MPTELEEWLEGRPDTIKATVAKVTPGRLYRFNEHKHVGFPVAYAENGTIRMCMLLKHNRDVIAFEREVFGVDVADCVLVSKKITISLNCWEISCSESSKTKPGILYDDGCWFCSLHDDRDGKVREHTHAS